MAGELWAKPSWGGGGGESLAAHTAAVVRAARMFEEEVAGATCAAVGLRREAWAGRVGRAVRAAAFLHDLGKSNDAFQAMMGVGGQGRGRRQPLRHEWLSGFVCVAKWSSRPGFEGIAAVQRFLDGYFAEDALGRAACVAAVLGHHRRTDSYCYREAGAVDVRLLFSYPGFAAFWAEGLRALGEAEVGAWGEVADGVICVTGNRVARELEAWEEEAEALVGAEGGEAALFFAVVKNLLICADVAASAGFEAAAFGRCLAKRCGEAELAAAARRRMGGGAVKPFQERVREVGRGERVGGVTAGCGAGKTVAAYLWAERWAAGRKVFFCYPTTGTATEGFWDYAAAFEGARLQHSRARVDLADAGMAYLQYLRADAELADLSEEAGAATSVPEAMRAWNSTIVVCTAHQVLGLMQNALSGLCLLPAVANGAVVFDEIHLYDGAMFGTLLRFLQVFRGVPALLMSASLTPTHRRLLEGALGERLAWCGGDGEWEGVARYEVGDGGEGWAAGVGGDLPVARIAAHVRRGEKVLVVANRVRQCVAWYERLREALGGEGEVVAYHSAFKYAHRKAIHEKVVAGMRREARGPFVAVTTQVCEVSLDISADVLVCELCPPAAVIQRLGRVNRVAEVTRAAPVYFVDVGKSAPYSGPEGWERECRRVVGELFSRGGAFSQRELTDLAGEAGGMWSGAMGMWIVLGWMGCGLVGGR